MAQVDCEASAHSHTRHELDALIGVGGRLEKAEGAKERLAMELARLVEERAELRTRSERLDQQLSESMLRREEERVKGLAERQGERTKLQLCLETERGEHKTLCERLASEIEEARAQYSGRKEHARKKREGEEARWRQAGTEAVAAVEEEWRAKFGRLCTELKTALKHETETRDAAAQEVRKAELAKVGEQLAGERARAEREGRLRRELEEEVRYIRRELVQDAMDGSRKAMPMPMEVAVQGVQRPAYPLPVHQQTGGGGGWGGGGATA
jgi:hypothetical protein